MVVNDRYMPRTAPRWASLHCHTLYSDGAQDPHVFWQMAHHAGIRYLALTDHNSLAGYAVLRQERAWLAEQGTRLFAGCEVTVRDPRLGNLAGHLTVLVPDSDKVSGVAALQRVLNVPIVNRDIRLFADVPCLILSGCIGSVAHKWAAQAGLWGSDPYIWSLADTLTLWQEDLHHLWFEVQPTSWHQGMARSIRRLVHLDVVATGDVHGTPGLPLRSKEQMEACFDDIYWHHAVQRSARVAQILARWEDLGHLVY